MRQNGASLPSERVIKIYGGSLSIPARQRCHSTVCRLAAASRAASARSHVSRRVDVLDQTSFWRVASLHYPSGWRSEGIDHARDRRASAFTRTKSDFDRPSSVAHASAEIDMVDRGRSRDIRLSVGRPPGGFDRCRVGPRRVHAILWRGILAIVRSPAAVREIRRPPIVALCLARAMRVITPSPIPGADVVARVGARLQVIDRTTRLFHVAWRRRRNAARISAANNSGCSHAAK